VMLREHFCSQQWVYFHCNISQTFKLYHFNNSFHLRLTQLWVLTEAVGPGKLTLSTLLAAFSVGRLISSPVLGLLADKWGYRMTLLISDATLIAGGSLYIMSTAASGVLLAQIFLGIGAGR
jgi:MFS family permease